MRRWTCLLCIAIAATSWACSDSSQVSSQPEKRSDGISEAEANEAACNVLVSIDWSGASQSPQAIAMMFQEVADLYQKIGDDRLATSLNSIASDVEPVRLKPVRNFEVFMKPNVSQGDIRLIESILRRSRGVLTLEYVSRAEALDRFAQEYPQLARRLPSRALPPSFRVKNTSGAFETLSSRLESMPKVDQVESAPQIYKHVDSSKLREILEAVCPEPDYSKYLQLPPRR